MQRAEDDCRHGDRRPVRLRPHSARRGLPALPFGPLLATVAGVGTAAGALLVWGWTALAQPAVPAAAPTDAAGIDTTLAKSSGKPTAKAKKAEPGTQVPAVAKQPLVSVQPAEAEHYARMDALLAPLYGHAPSAEDLARVKEVQAAVAALDFAKAREIEGQIQDQASRKLVRWMMLRSDALPFGPNEIDEFRRANPDFAESLLLRQRVEEALLTRTADPKAIRDFLERSPPVTGAGYAALAVAHLAQGDRAKAQELVARAWREHDFGQRVESVILNTLGGLLTTADHKWRIDRLLMKDARWKGERTDRMALVRRVLPYLPEAEQKKVAARIAVYLRDKGAAKGIVSLPADALQDWGVYFSVVQLNRRSGSDAEEDDTAKGEEQSADAGKLKEAWRLLLAAPTDPALVVSPDDWWIERRVNAYAALRERQPRVAYDLVREPGPLSVNPLKDAQQLAGWIALRHLNDPAAAERHFLAMRAAADGPISTSSSEYWLARTYTALGNPAKAQVHLRNAAPYFDTFYGQIARQLLDPGGTRLDASQPRPPTAAEAQRFVERDAAKAVIIARRAGLEPLVRQFLAALRVHLAGQPGELLLVAHMSHALGDTQWAVRTGKAGLVRGHNLTTYAFPVHTFPAYKPLREPPETAFLMGIARQESEFNTLIVSGAGARGVLQVMPITARHICRDYKVRCEIARLSTDPAYNTMMASAYIGDRMAEYAGSYIMTLAGYNAGPGRVRQWVREFGDPRDPGIDPIDWVERIPFEETRDYVKKVLANVQVYRARLGEEASALRILADLERARGKVSPLAVPAPVPAADPEPAGPPAANATRPTTVSGAN